MWGSLNDLSEEQRQIIHTSWNETDPSLGHRRTNSLRSEDLRVRKHMQTDCSREISKEWAMRADITSRQPLLRADS